MIFKFCLVSLLLSASLNGVIGDLSCDYRFDDIDDFETIYTCFISNQIFCNESEIEVVTGLHQINRVDSDVFAITAMGSTIEVFPSLIGNNFRNLRTINLTRSGVKTFYQEIENCGRLTQLDLSFNAISKIPAGILKNCTNLFSVFLNENQLEEFAVDAFDGLTQLYTLNMQNNKIKTVSATIGKLDNLTYLDLSGNQIDAIPDGFFDRMPVLYELVLSNNLISHWNASTFANEARVTILKLDGNLIASLDDNAFVNMQSLVILSIGSLLEKIPEFLHLSNVVDLTLDNNRVQDVSLQSFVHMPRLTYLKINNNRIETLNFTAFNGSMGFPWMEILSLTNNSITTLPANAFAIFNSLRELDLSENKIQQLNANFFKTNRYDPILDVSNNNISRIEKDALRVGGRSLILRGKGNFCFDSDVKIEWGFNDYVLDAIMKDCLSSTGTASSVLLNIFVLFSSVFFCLLLKQ